MYNCTFISKKYKKIPGNAQIYFGELLIIMYHMIQTTTILVRNKELLLVGNGWCQGHNKKYPSEDINSKWRRSVRKNPTNK